MINATNSFLTLIAFAFSFSLMSFFDVRRYNASYLSCSYAPRPMKFIAFIDELVEENKSISSKRGSFKILP